MAAEAAMNALRWRRAGDGARKWRWLQNNHGAFYRAEAKAENIEGFGASIKANDEILWQYRMILFSAHMRTIRRKL